MKKALSLILALVLCLSLCACGGAQTSTEDSSDMLVGTWSCEREAGQDSVTLAHTQTLELYKGGNCYSYALATNNEKYNNLSGKWVLEGDILTITLSTGAVIGYVLDTTTTPFTLTKQMDTSIILVKNG